MACCKKSCDSRSPNFSLAAMRDSLSALGMVLIKENESGEKAYFLKPLALPTLVRRGQDFTCNVAEVEKKAYSQMFRGKARLKVYVGDYNRAGNGGGILY